MNYIALTGKDMPAMAHAAEHLLELVERADLRVSIFLHVNCTAHAVAVTQRAGDGIGQLWRVGDDDTHPQLDRLVDVHIPSLLCAVPEHLQEAVRISLDRFRGRMASAAAFSHPYQPITEKTP